MFFKKEKNKNDDLIKVAALLIHAAKIDENFSINEEKIIKKALLEIGYDNLDDINEIQGHALACPALPLCGLAMTEAERILPDVLKRIEK